MERFCSERFFSSWSWWSKFSSLSQIFWWGRKSSPDLRESRFFSCRVAVLVFVGGSLGRLVFYTLLLQQHHFFPLSSFLQISSSLVVENL